MATYDSESGSEDGSAYQTTKVLLGYASKEPTEDTISIIGGQPAWLEPSSPPSAALARCKVCHDVMAQLLQLHADLPDHFPSHERRLHLFACRRKTCKRKAGSVRAVRTTRASAIESEASPAPASSAPAPTSPPQPSAPRDLGGSIFGGGGGGKLFGAPPPPPSASSTAANTGPNELSSTFAAKARIAPDSSSSVVIPTASSEPAEPWPASKDLPKPYASYYLDAGYEELDADYDKKAPSHSNAAASMAVDAPTTSGGDEKDELDLFESIHDRTFQHFADRLAQNPEQVLRYEFGGSPLLYSRDDAVGSALAPHHEGKAAAAGEQPRIPNCARCGGRRVFEVQLVPQAIMELEADDEGAAVDGMEWATVLVGVCMRDCAAEMGTCLHVEEWVGVQWEEERRK